MRQADGSSSERPFVSGSSTPSGRLLLQGGRSVPGPAVAGATAWALALVAVAAHGRRRADPRRRATVEPAQDQPSAPVCPRRRGVVAVAGSPVAMPREREPSRLAGISKSLTSFDGSSLEQVVAGARLMARTGHQSRPVRALAADHSAPDWCFGLRVAKHCSGPETDRLSLIAFADGGESVLAMYGHAPPRPIPERCMACHPGAACAASRELSARMSRRRSAELRARGLGSPIYDCRVVRPMTAAVIVVATAITALTLPAGGRRGSDPTRSPA